jgi:hypothetical protein
MTAQECILKSGGFAQFANHKHVRIITLERREQQGVIMHKQVVDLRPGKPQIGVPDQSVIVVPEVSLIY